jgi:hypothetical protein
MLVVLILFNAGENMQATTIPAIAEEAIRVRAYLLWESEGRLHGRDIHYWSEAIGQLQSEAVAIVEPPTPVKKKVSRAKQVSKVSNGGTKHPDEDRDVTKPSKSAGKGVAEGDSGADSQ